MAVNTVGTYSLRDPRRERLRSVGDGLFRNMGGSK